MGSRAPSGSGCRQHQVCSNQHKAAVSTARELGSAPLWCPRVSLSLPALPAMHTSSRQQRRAALLLLHPATVGHGIVQDGFCHCLRALALHACLYLRHGELALQEEVQPAVREEDNVLHNPVQKEKGVRQVCRSTEHTEPCPDSSHRQADPTGRSTATPQTASSERCILPLLPSQRCVQELHSLFQELLQPLSPFLNEFIRAPHKEGGFPRQLWDGPAGREQMQQLRVRSPQHWSKKMRSTTVAAAGTLPCAELDPMSASIPHPCVGKATPLLFLSTSAVRAHKIPRAMELWCLCGESRELRACLHQASILLELSPQPHEFPVPAPHT